MMFRSDRDFDTPNALRMSIELHFLSTSIWEGCLFEHFERTNILQRSVWYISHCISPFYC